MAVTRPARRTLWRWWPVGLAWALEALVVAGLAAVVWLHDLIHQTGRTDLLLLTTTNMPPLLGAVGAATVGAVVASRRPRHPAGWLMLTLGLSMSAAGAAMGYANYGVALGTATPATAVVTPYIPATIVLAMASSSLLLLVTPTGSLPSPRWRWLAAVAVTLDSQTAEFLAVVNQTMQPANVSL